VVAATLQELGTQLARVVEGVDPLSEGGQEEPQAGVISREGGPSGRGAWSPCQCECRADRAGSRVLKGHGQCSCL
jgi:hypothetical protein